MFDMDQHWRQDSEDGRDWGPAYKSLRGSEDTPDFVVPVCCTGMRPVAESLFVEVEGKDVGHPLAEGDTEAAVAAEQGHCFV